MKHRPILGGHSSSFPLETPRIENKDSSLSRYVPKRDNESRRQEDSIKQSLRASYFEYTKRTLHALMLATLLTGCAIESSESEVDELSVCSSTEIENRFIVEWNDGSVTIEQAADEEDFVETVLIENEDRIANVEHDHRVGLIAPPKIKESEVQAKAAPVNWGVEISEADEVWPHANGSGITVAVIDSGADVSHPQLRNQLYQNAAEVGGSDGVDDDGNGLTDDKNGWDFVFDTGNVTEVLIADSHGTHVAGVIAAEHVGDSFTKGVAPGAKILPLNFMDASAGGTLGDAIRAINYAVSRGARVINASWGSGSCSSILEQRVAQLGAEGVLFVAAAGNSGTDLAIFPEFPAAYGFNHSITVGASTINDFRAGFSNFGGSLVHLLAPGLDIISTVPSDDPKTNKSGTSMATPFVAGAAAVLFSSKPSATPAEIKEVLMQSVDNPGNYGNNDAASQGRLNLRKAYNLLNGTNI